MSSRVTRAEETRRRVAGDKDGRATGEGSSSSHRTSPKPLILRLSSEHSINPLVVNGWMARCWIYWMGGWMMFG